LSFLVWLLLSCSGRYADNQLFLSRRVALLAYAGQECRLQNGSVENYTTHKSRHADSIPVEIGKFKKRPSILRAHDSGSVSYTWRSDAGQWYQFPIPGRVLQKFQAKCDTLWDIRYRTLDIWYSTSDNTNQMPPRNTLLKIVTIPYSL